jgi:dihydroxyacetone kinase
MMELAIVARRAVAVLEARGLAVERVFVGTFLSALEMAGVSLSVLTLDDCRLTRLDAATDAPAWHAAPARDRQRTEVAQDAPTAASTPPLGPPKTAAGQRLEHVLRAVIMASEFSAASLAELDRRVGDGDFGDTLTRGARAVASALGSYVLDDPAATLHALSATLETAMGGTSGPLYGVFFLRAASCLKGRDAADPRSWAEAFRAGCTGLADLGGARPGDRTLLDALLPARDAFTQSLAAGRPLADALTSAVAAADAGADATAQMRPHRGRSSYLGDRVLGHQDPGAAAVAIWIGAIAVTINADIADR